MSDLFLCCWESINSFFTRKLAHLELVISVWSSFYLLTYFFFPKVALKVNEMLHNWLKSHKKVQIEEVLKRAKTLIFSRNQCFFHFYEQNCSERACKVQGVEIIIPSLVYYALLECFFIGTQKGCCRCACGVI